MIERKLIDDTLISVAVSHKTYARIKELGLKYRAVMELGVKYLDETAPLSDRCRELELKNKELVDKITKLAVRVWTLEIQNTKAE